MDILGSTEFLTAERPDAFLLSPLYAPVQELLCSVRLTVNLINSTRVRFGYNRMLTGTSHVSQKLVEINSNSNE